jgi:tetratricopeptide (TPR) repeat protein
MKMSWQTARVAILGVATIVSGIHLNNNIRLQQSIQQQQQLLQQQQRALQEQQKVVQEENEKQASMLSKVEPEADQKTIEKPTKDKASQEKDTSPQTPSTFLSSRQRPVKIDDTISNDNDNRAKVIEESEKLANDAKKARNYPQVISITTNLLKIYPDTKSSIDFVSIYAYRASAYLELEKKDLAIADMQVIAEILRYRKEYRDDYLNLITTINYLNSAAPPSSQPISATSQPVKLSPPAIELPILTPTPSRIPPLPPAVQKPIQILPKPLPSSKTVHIPISNSTTQRTNPSPISISP